MEHIYGATYAVKVSPADLPKFTTRLLDAAARTAAPDVSKGMKATVNLAFDHGTGLPKTQAPGMKFDVTREIQGDRSCEDWTYLGEAIKTYVEETREEGDGTIPKILICVVTTDGK
jgi:hypothetical protein